MKIGEYTVIQNPHMLDRIFTKKQTRKFRNRRWVKKYKKNHSRMVPQNSVMVNTIDKVIFAHPATYTLLQCELEKMALTELKAQESDRSYSPLSTSMFGMPRKPGPFFGNCVS